MASLANCEPANLQADLCGLKATALTGVRVGSGSIIPNFSDRSSVVVECSCEVRQGEPTYVGHDCTPATAAPRFAMPNTDSVDANLDENPRITFTVDTGSGIRPIADDTGFEAYVVNLPTGVFPVL
ncbi:MAG TPA: hypothetical protein VMB34_33620 [Acetobacteraceae bacterium]|nr:hypothetical protein [Caulobacteraceae bacterium]HUB16923.1 hypothetical protein [Acetobacteraceae bacterium]